MPEDDLDDVLKDLVAEERERLEQRLERIEARIEDRSELYEDKVDRLENRIKDCQSEIQQIFSRPYGGNVEKRETLEATIEELQRELHDVRRQFWNDLEQLESEKRDVLEQLDELDRDGSELSELL